MPKVSIILPVYNVEKYLDQCFQSLLNQTLKDIEIIAVDDGSSDNSYNILKKYEALDSRIKIFSQENKYAGIARNLGLDNAKGEYIGFVDPDDWVKLEMFEKLYKKAIEYDSDIVITQAYSYHEDRWLFKYAKGTYKFRGIPRFCFKRNFSPLELKENIFKLPVANYLKLYKRSLIEENNIRYPNIKTSEDQEFYVHTTLLAKKIICLNEFLYFYRKKRLGSHSKTRNLNALDAIKIFYGIEDLLNKKNLMETYKIPFLKKYARNSIKWYKKAHKSIKNNYLKELIPQLVHIQKTYDDNLLKKFYWYKDYKKLLSLNSK